MDTPNEQTPPIPQARRATDQICWQSADGLVGYAIKARPRRWPQSDYPVLVMNLRPRSHTRIQRLEDGSGGVEALLTYEEIEELLEAANRIAILTGKGELYEIKQRVPPKDPARKALWNRIKAAHHRQKLWDGDGRCQ